MVSLVDVSPSTVMALNVVRTTFSTARCNTEGRIAASVTM